MLKEQQQGQMSSSAQISSEDIGVEQSTAMSTHEISSAEILDRNEQSSNVDDIVCKVIITSNKRKREIRSPCNMFALVSCSPFERKDISLIDWMYFVLVCFE